MSRESLFAALLLGSLGACGSPPGPAGPTVIDLTPRVRDVRIVERSSKAEPDWVTRTQPDDKYVYFVGTAESDRKAEASSLAWQDALVRIRQSIESRVGSEVEVDIHEDEQTGDHGPVHRSRLSYRSRNTTTANGTVLNAIQVDVHWYHQVKRIHIPHTGQEAGQEDTYHFDLLARVDRRDFDALVQQARQPARR